ncbi:MAG: hypothetical protein P4M05_19945 [Bradyrhizobium sp.]|jgi:hypothetical protein|nr:hypothetical protein [Bradyrhizobium sp.]
MVLSLNYTDKIAFFFGNTPHGNCHSTLALIRNDINTLSQGGENYLAFPRAMCLMVALDLLGKMMEGSDSIGKVGDRFKNFVRFALNPTIHGNKIGDRIWAFRNALHHSYRMHTDWTPDGSGGHTASWQFQLIDAKAVSWLTRDESSSTIINLARLHDESEAGFQRFQTLLASSSNVTQRQGFESMFTKHGWMAVGTLNVVSP